MNIDVFDFHSCPTADISNTPRVLSFLSVPPFFSLSCSPPLDQRPSWHFEVRASQDPRVLPLATDFVILTAKPTAALLPLRAGPSAFISSTSAKSAAEVTPSQDAQGPPLSVTGKSRREVPLPSQEKKEGAMQYALYVLSPRALGLKLIIDAQNYP